MDSLTAHYLARELDALWRGHRVRACVFDGAAAKLSMAIEGTDAVEFDLSTPHVQVRRAAAGSGELARDRRAQLEGWRVESVDAPIDDRRISIELIRAGRFKGSAERRATLTVSAVPNARGAELRDAGGHRLAALGSKVPPLSEARPIPELSDVARAARERDEQALLGARWMSAELARWLIAEPELAAERYSLIASDAPPTPARCGAALLPFPMCADAVRTGSLIAPRNESGNEASEPRIASEGDASSTRRQRARARMERELERAREAPVLRAIADALVSIGDDSAPETVLLADGAEVRVPAKPGESAREVVERLYSAAKSMERAQETLPARIAALGRERLHDEERHAETRARGARSESRAARPYRVYRSSTGLEIRVGRGAAANDELTFRDSSPDDIWLHARDAAGAHVVLRWQSAETPPASALEEAAMLAAWHSKSRGSALVPVDWTRRKYVRRARGGPPGSVIVQSARTVMARPDAARVKRLRES